MPETAVLVVGAGPAGAALSCLLARAGLDVLLVDRAAWPRDKTCGDCLSPRSLAVLRRLDVLTAVLAQGRKIGRASLVAPGGLRITTEIPACGGGLDCVVTLPRLQFDDMLRRCAIAAGAAFRSQFRVRGFVEEKGRVAGVRAETAEGPAEVRAQVVVLATGSNLALAAQAGMIDERPRIGLAARAYFEGIAGLGDEIELLFDGAPLPGYAWVFPTGESSANVGAGCFLPRGSRRLPIRQVFDQAIASPRLAARLRDARRAGPVRSLPMHFGFASCRLARPGLLLVGEAAGLVNPLSGEGIDLALESAEIAADNLAASIPAGESAEQIARTHRSALRARFSSQLRSVAWVRDFYLRRWSLDRLAAAAQRREELRRLLVHVALGATDPLTAFRPRVLAQVLLG